MKILSSEEARQRFIDFQKGRNYSAMYSSILGGIVQNPEHMYVPIDDHMVHRGDGIFEAIRYSPRGLFAIDEHIERLFASADYIHMKMRWSADEIKSICSEVVKHSGLQQGQIRLFVSRGPGDFSPNPYTTVGSQLYVIATEFKKMDQKYYDRGAKLMISSQPVKLDFFPKVKSCNYLPNVLMKKESVDHQVDFAVNLTADGYIAEGPTENIMILDKQGRLIVPQFDYTLRGTTLIKTLKIAEKLKAELSVSHIGLENITLNQLLEATEVMMVGTTLGVLPITEILDQKKKKHSLGSVGPVAKTLNAELEKLF